MALLKYLIPIIFITFSFTELARIELGSGVAFNIIDVVTLSLFIFWLGFVKKTKKYLLQKPILFFIFICIVTLVLSFFKFNINEILIGGLYLVRFTLYSSLYFVFKDIGDKNNSVSLYMIISGLIIIFLGYLQIIFFPSLKSLFHLGWDEHMYRMFSTFLDPNFMGTFIVLYLVFLFFIRDNYKKSKKIHYLLNISLALGLISLILTFSRGGILMLLVSVLSYTVMKKSYKLLAGISIVLIFSVIILSPRFYIVNNDLFRLPSFNQRVENAKEAISIFQENPLIGVGFNNFRYAREMYGYHDPQRYGLSHSGAGSDNSYAFVLATTGIIGFVFYLYLLLRIYKLGFLKVNSSPYGMILIISLAGLMVNSLFINSLFYSFVMIWMWILVGLTESS